MFVLAMFLGSLSFGGGPGYLGIVLLYVSDVCLGSTLQCACFFQHNESTRLPSESTGRLEVFKAVDQGSGMVPGTTGNLKRVRLL